CPAEIRGVIRYAFVMEIRRAYTAKALKLATHKLGEDELSTRSASLSYYFHLALFPLFLFLVSLIGVFAGPSSQLQENIVLALGRLAPGSASELVRNVVHQTFKSSSGIK